VFIDFLPEVKQIRILAGLGLVWQPTEARGQLIFVDFPFSERTVFELFGSIFERPSKPEF